MTPKWMSLSMQYDAGFEQYRKATRRDVFLAEMDQVVPWAALCAVIRQHYPKDPAAGAGGRRAVGLERMLRIHFLQQGYALSDPAVEEALSLPLEDADPSPGRCRCLHDRRLPDRLPEKGV
jgi:IS5 family transposase